MNPLRVTIGHAKTLDRRAHAGGRVHLIDCLEDAGLRMCPLTLCLGTCLPAADGDRGLGFAIGVLMAAARKLLVVLVEVVRAAAEMVGPVPLVVASLAAQHQDACRPPKEASPALLDPEVKDGAGEDYEHSFGDRDDEVTPTHAVFGLFLSARLQDIRAGLMPVVLITLCSNWDLVAMRFLLLVNTETSVVQAGSGPVLPITCWTGDTRLTGLATTTSLWARSATSASAASPSASWCFVSLSSRGATVWWSPTPCASTATYTTALRATSGGGRSS